MSEDNAPILGIDLGTTFSACAVWRDDAAHIICNSHGDALTPSVIGLDDDGHLLVGKAARNRLVTHPQMTVACFKRFIGTDHKVRLARNREFTATELSAMVLRSLKKDAESELGCSITRAVISVPAYFNESQRQATRDAGEIAGLEVNRLINEPTAAAMAHGLHEKDEKRFIILDLGGGTFDVSILEYFDRILQVHATSGDSALGGEDFNDALLRRFAEIHNLFGALEDRKLRQQLYVKIETAKRQLAPNRPVEISFHANGKEYTWEVDENTFRDVTANLLMRARKPMEKAMRDASIRPQDIDDVVLVGGASRMSVFRSIVATLFGRLPRTDADPDLTVVCGAAIQAALVQRDASLDDVVLTDVAPFSLGIRAVSETGLTGAGSNRVEHFSPIISRNSVVPVSRVQRFATVMHMQPSVLVEIFQGESRQVDNNLFLGEIKVPVPLGLAGREAIDVRFSYDVNGLLEVDVEVVSTRRKFSKVIENRPGQLSDQEKRASQKRLAVLKVLPRDQEVVRAVLARADRMYASLLGFDRETLGQHIDAFQATLVGQDMLEIQRACRNFSSLLDKLDKDIWE